MNDKLAFLAGVVCGASLMYLLDPSAGGRRRGRVAGSVAGGVGTVRQRLGFAHSEEALEEAQEVVRAASRMPVGGNLGPTDDGSGNPYF